MEPADLRRRLARAARRAGPYFPAGLAVTVLGALVLSRIVDVRQATPL